MSLCGRHVLVTGAGGFIGSHVVERLTQLGARTRALIHYNSAGSWGWLDESPVRDDIEVVLGDVCDPESVRAAVDGIDTVFHLAALIAIPYSYRAPGSYVRTNVEGTLNVLQAARERGVARVVHTSTSEVYGTALRVPMDEEHPLQAQSPYAASKIGGDKIAEAFACSYGLPVCTIRPFNTYGPRQSARAIIPTIVSQTLTGASIRLGNLGPTRDFTFVDDTVEAFLRAADTPEAAGRVINVGAGREISVDELARAILDVVGRDVPIVPALERQRPSRSEVLRLCADSSRARAVLGWEPQTPLREGLTRTIKWIEAHLDRYRPDIYAI